MSEHERWADAAGAYVLNAMPEDERRAYEAHLEGCDACSAEVEELRPAAQALPMASPPMTPPRELKLRIMAEVEREAALLAQAGPEADRPRAPAAPRRRWALGGWRLAPVAAALLVAGLLAGFAIGGLNLGDETQTYAVTVDRAQAPDASAELTVADGEAMLVAERLPTPPNGRVYQVWIKRDGVSAPEPTDTLFMPSRDGSAAAAVPGAMDDASAVLVTHEPEGGSSTPSQAPLLTAPLS